MNAIVPVSNPNKYLPFFLIHVLSVLSVAHAGLCGENLQSLEKEIAGLIDKSKTSVVTVASKFSREVYFEKESGILSFFKTEIEKQDLTYLNIGTGVIIDDKGHILTRSSIVFGAESNIVTTASGEEVAAEFVGHDPETGFAVLKPNDGSNLAPAKLGKMEEIHLGKIVVIIGNSMGVFPSIDIGIINGLRDDNMIQISTNLNPGNNGSPIFNFNGEVVGVVAGKLNVGKSLPVLWQRSGAHELTLAYPIYRVKRIAEDLIEFGYVRKGWLGVVGYYDGQKPKIREIKQNSPAQKAGLLEGDIIAKYANREVRDITQLIHLVEATAPGQTIPLEYNREGQTYQTEIAIGEKSLPSNPYFGEVEYNRTGYSAFESSTQQILSSELGPLTEKNKLLEMRINYLESELEKLKKLIEN